MDRYLHDLLLKDLARKMVILTGPRQIGKTWLAKEVMTSFANPQYLNFDQVTDARIIQTQSWAATADMLVLDELHKMQNWKSFAKGVFDTRTSGQAILITGSARLDTFRQSGPSLAGRYFHYRLGPLSVRELAASLPPSESLPAINRLGGFPEPFLSGSDVEARRWRLQYYTDLIREDILEFSRIQEIRVMRLLLELLRQRVGSPLSYTSIAEDIQVAPNTVRKYVDILESLGIVFLVRPFHQNIARSLVREPKVYFYDSGYVEGDEGLRLENTCAVCLLKHVHFLQDAGGEDIALHYIRTKDGREIDFALSRQGRLVQLIETKLSDAVPSAHLKYFLARLPDTRALQLVQHLRREQRIDGIDVLDAGKWLATLAA